MKETRKTDPQKGKTNRFPKPWHQRIHLKIETNRKRKNVAGAANVRILVLARSIYHMVPLQGKNYRADNIRRSCFNLENTQTKERLQIIVHTQLDKRKQQNCWIQV